MIQKGDDLINGAGGSHQQQNYLYHQNVVNSQRIDFRSAELVQAMSFEDFLSQGENTLPSVETVLPHYAIAIPTPPPSLPSPSVNMTINSTTTSVGAAFNHNVTTNQPFQLQHLTPQHYENTMLGNFNLQQQQQPFHPLNEYGSTNIASTTGGQLFVDSNNSNYVVTKAEPKNENDLIYISDASTVDADENLADDEPYTYLQNLNSDNLMKFSQQSALQQMIEEQMVEPKVNLNLIPTCEEHDIGGYDFSIQVNSADSHPQRPGVLYAKDSQRLYVKTNENIYIDCSYKVKMPIQPLHVRVFPVYTKDTSAPVLRCQNHISKDAERDETKRNCLLRCQNPDATYYGTDAGKSVCDRYAVLVPLNASIKVSDSSSHLKQQLIIDFKCNNSCMNRRQTSIIFVLEGSSGEILAQRVLNVKVSTCPKRDKRLYESPRGSKRRALAEPAFCGSVPKTPKYEESSTREEISRSSYDDATDDDASRSVNANSSGGNNAPYRGDNVDVNVEKETGNFVLTLKYKTRQQMLQALRLLYSNAIANEVFFEAPINDKETRESETLKCGYLKALRLKRRRSSHFGRQ